jgi:hypothetical protein
MRLCRNTWHRAAERAIHLAWHQGASIEHEQE